MNLISATLTIENEGRVIKMHLTITLTPVAFERYMKSARTEEGLAGSVCSRQVRLRNIASGPVGE